MPFKSQIVYNSSHGSVSWVGHSALDDSDFSKFLTGSVASRLDDSSAREEMHNHLRGLSLTGMGQTSLEEVLAAEVTEDRDWAAGEAIAEAILEENHNIVFPWNTERDKRNPFASLPGADIVGLQRDGLTHRFAFGEVKCSSEKKWPPQVMSGRTGGIGHQIDAIANDLRIICQLLYWLLPRVKGTRHEIAFNEASIRYFNSQRCDVALFGVLVRDQAANEKDLKGRGRKLGSLLKSGTICRLIALYLPWPISSLPAAIRAGVTS
ncbi:MAG: hypothetical protein JNJ77_07565 [Planctomycetia bacterium]|nr:hypothetical protein [Planctomycetia bacterium]